MLRFLNERTKTKLKRKIRGRKSEREEEGKKNNKTTRINEWIYYVQIKSDLNAKTMELSNKASLIGTHFSKIPRIIRIKTDFVNIDQQRLYLVAPWHRQQHQQKKLL